jgi:hypothetical protein
LVAFLRPEIKFSNFEALLAQIYDDINLSKTLNELFKDSNGELLDVYRSAEEFTSYSCESLDEFLAKYATNESESYILCVK